METARLSRRDMPDTPPDAADGERDDMPWALRYAPHLGYVPPDVPLFRAHAGPDVVDHVHFAASQGMAGVLDPWLPDRPAAQRQAIKAALTDTGLACGCVVAVPMPRFMEPFWTAEGGQEELHGHLTHALAVAADFGSTNIAVVLFGEEDTTPGTQRRRVVDRLRAGADLAAEQGATLVIEPIVGLPGMYLKNFADGVELIREAGHPNVKLIFDTGHVFNGGEPILETFVDAYDDIGLVQLADMPGRVQMGGGEIDFVPLLTHALLKGYSGLVELEHDWTEPGLEGERRGIDALRAIDAEVRSRAGAASTV